LRVSAVDHELQRHLHVPILPAGCDNPVGDSAER
jgi:hypothetical protein